MWLLEGLSETKQGLDRSLYYECFVEPGTSKPCPKVEKSTYN